MTTTRTKPQTIVAPSGKAAQPRCFVLTWNNSKDPEYGKGKNAWKQCYCCLFPNGWVTTDFGPAYRTMHELTTMLEEHGEHTITWLEDEHETSA